MKLQYASDLHLEFNQNTQWLQETPLEVTGDVLVLAGDITIFGDDELENHPFFDWCAENYRETILVPGNHEYYDGVEMRDTLTDFEKLLRPNVRYLNNRSIVIDDTELFVTTLWSKVKPQNEEWIESRMTDCRRSVLDGHTLRGADYSLLHELCFSWLDDALKQSTAKHKVVVTHHSPVNYEDPTFATNNLTDAFIIPLEDYIEQSDIDAWIFGHTHYNAAEGVTLGRTRICTNQLGYVMYGICSGYNPARFIDLDEMPNPDTEKEVL